MITDETLNELFKLQDVKYRDFQAKLMPTMNPENVIGVRTPELRKLAKQLAKRDDVDEFLDSLPHKYFDENQLHAFIISEIKDYEKCLDRLEAFLPYVDNWATCDQMSPKIFKKHRAKLMQEIERWIESDYTYTVRFAIGMLMEHFLDEDFDIVYADMVADVHSEEYYINMMIAWYFATALAKQYDAIIPYLIEQRLDTWTHNKTIQKAVESYRITPEQKTYLRTLRIKEKK
ncbi:3-methyladenine DNA glycosylase AlkD [Pseudobutyrivibrio sp. ACV-2]|uniref:DNA alkylation repair protein n=1 Tax=Pseudobutyrivibrio sp. ACV-2 TaxID=1520801 RepID=UPI00089C99B4|nr:DNA alkylation repair protein [Pseudobutyrivibrio sp. ACV-2]SEA81593.1 3-methyladenine DNA glycosylase AlkD [Pseudobutyrivibrio sp. ACV-2]